MTTADADPNRDHDICDPFFKQTQSIGGSQSEVLGIKRRVEVVIPKASTGILDRGVRILLWIFQVPESQANETVYLHTLAPQLRQLHPGESEKNSVGIPVNLEMSNSKKEKQVLT